MRRLSFTLPLLLTSALMAQTPKSAGVETAAIDTSANPCADFYQYACGNWISAHPIPPDQATWGRFNELADRNREILHSILERSSGAGGQRSAVDQKVGDFYAACMDEAAIEKKGAAPLQPELDRIAALASKRELAAEIQRLHSQGAAAFFNFGSGQDAKDSTQVIAQAIQGGLSMPGREFYIRTDAHSEEVRQKYVAHVRKMFELLGYSAEKAAAAAATVMRIETALAQAATDRVELRDPNKRFHKMSAPELAALTPSFDWPAYYKAAGLSIAALNVTTPDFFKGLEQALAANSLDDLKTYLAWHVLSEAAPILPAAFASESFDFFRRTLTGAKEMQPRWKRCVELTDRQLGEAVGQKFVQEAFGAQSKQDTLRMVGEIEAEMAKDIQSLDWMSAETKKQALAKLRAVANKIGYPERWRDYGAVRVTRGDALGNSERAAGFEYRRRLAKIGKPVDKLEWGMSPPTVNAYYNPAMNDINFPAGILQPPFYFQSGDKAANYGAIGAVVGHELTHGFDDQGRQFDGQGNLRDWWTVEDAKAFKQRADCIVDEYGGFTATGDVKLNGRLTLGENAADNGGLRLAYMALLDSLEAHTVPADSAGGFTPQQRFFLGFAQIWCQNLTPEAARLQALTNPHSLGRYRANGVLQNMPEFQKAFSCKTGDAMVSASPCRVW